VRAPVIGSADNRGMIQFTPHRLLNLGPMARRLRVTTSWLRAEADAGRIPHVKAGRAYLFDPEAVEKVLLERAGQEGISREGQQ
jgi:excisionase family DNA binding protein